MAVILGMAVGDDKRVAGGHLRASPAVHAKVYVHDADGVTLRLAKFLPLHAQYRAVAPRRTMSTFQELLAGPFGPVIILGLRATDVSMATVRMLLIMRGQRLLVPLIGFFEILIWVMAVGTVVQHLNSPLHVIGYAAGFATGNFLGLLLEERMAIGLATVRTMVKTGGAELAAELRTAGFGVTEMIGQGRDGAVEVLYSVIPRRAVKQCVALIDAGAPESFVVVDEPRTVHRGWQFPQRKK